MSFEDQISRWSRTLNNPNEIFRRAMLEHKEAILDANVAQLRGGKDSMGEFLREYVSDAYAHFKQEIGSEAPFGIADLRLTGDFYAGFYLEWTEGEFKISSSDWKRSKLEAQYGENIFGLSEETVSELQPFLIDVIQNIIRYGVL